MKSKCCKKRFKTYTYEKLKSEIYKYVIQSAND